MLRFVVIVRHGENEAGAECLTKASRLQINILARQIKELIQDGVPVNGGGILLMSSTAEYAQETAGIISFWLDMKEADIVLTPLLFSDSVKQPQLGQVTKMVSAKRKECQAIIFVTHHEYAEELPSFLGKNELNLDVQRTPIDKGNAILIDVTLRKVRLLNGDEAVNL